MRSLRNSWVRCLLLLSLAVFVQTSCTKAYKLRKKEENLKAAVLSYNTNMRWQLYAKASEFVKDEDRDPFIEHFETMRDTLQIMEMDLVSAKVDKKDPNKATARVWVSFFLMPNPSLKKELRIQEWEFDKKRAAWYVSPPEIKHTK